MAAIANLSLNDGQVTPVARTFNPSVASLNESRWLDRSLGRLVGIPTIVLKSSLPSKTSPHFKVMAEISIPVMETITNANAAGYAAPPQEAYKLKGMVTFICPARSSEAERRDIAAFMASLLGNSQFTTLVRQFEQPY